MGATDRRLHLNQRRDNKASRYRRQGLGRAVSVFGLHQARASGATDAVVSCRGDENYPVPRRLYGSIAFGELTRDVVFAK